MDNFDMTVFNHRGGEYLTVGDARLYYEQLGAPDAPVLILLHGGLGHIETFNAITPHLAHRWRVIGIDSRGQGMSTLGSAPLTYERMQHDVERVIEHLALERVSLIGHSDGGIVALRMAASQAVTVDRLVTIGAHWALGENDPARALYEGITAAKWRGLFAEDVARYEAINPQPDFARLLEAVRGMWLDDSEHGYPAASVGGITAPLLVVRGDRDRLVSRANALELVEQVPGAQLLNLALADHSPHETHPQWLLPVVEAFLNQ
ncbi:alpha/beta fold hydrolase [Pseudomonas parafulva]|nr:alpha/beta fold hydrolase [Pseudomonas parafulva]